MKGLLIHVGEYLSPAIINEEKPETYKLEYAKFDDDGVASKGISHVDPEFKGYTYGDDPNNRIKKNLAKLDIGDYIFFMWTFLGRHSQEKLRYIPAYLKIKEITTVREILEKSLGNSLPYCHNDHVREALHGKQEERKFTIFVGGKKHSGLCKSPLRLDKKLVEKLELRNGSGALIASEIGKKHDRNGRIMTEIEVINVYTRVPKIINETQVLTILGEMKCLC
jgi:hypothetical protein